MFGLAYVVSMAAGVGLPLLLTAQFNFGMFQMFVPLMGRAGSLVLPDIAVGVYTCFCVFTATPHMVRLVHSITCMYNTLLRYVDMLLRSLNSNLMIGIHVLASWLSRAYVLQTKS